MGRAAAHPGADERQHDALVQGQSLPLLHLDALLVQTLHGVPVGEGPVPQSVHRHLQCRPRGAVGCGRSSGRPRGPPPPQVSHPRQWTRCSHLARVGLPAAVDLTEAASPDDAVHTEVVHGQLRGVAAGGSLQAAQAPTREQQGVPPRPLTQGHRHPSQVPPCLEPSALGFQHQPHSRPWGLTVDSPRRPGALGRSSRERALHAHPAHSRGC